MPKKSYVDPFDDIFKFFRRVRKTEPVKCDCCGMGNKPQNDCPVCSGKGVKYIITEM